ncbi:MAG TPA: biotin-independent malonate decarboxylase subunit gamma [Casimicrobiaceae bacterium]|nr:biotin-independent malonate decarboxylase subunit gamma [Casimicrobiaceae bacterium]
MNGSALRTLAPRERIATLADANSVRPVDAALEAVRPSPHLARWGIAAQDDDGVVVARVTMQGEPVLVAAQDERFLRGSVGANHGDALRRLFEVARSERPRAVVVVAASGGVRLHEANPAEASLARALAALLDLRSAGVPVLSLCVADTFGGASVLACAAERIAMLPGARLGLSGPAVIETARGRSEVDSSDANALAALFGAQARSAAGYVDLVDDSVDAVRAWIDSTVRGAVPFASRVVAVQNALGARLHATSQEPRAPVVSAVARELLPRTAAPLYTDADPVDEGAWLWRVRGRSVWLTRAIGTGTLGPHEAHGLSAAILAHLGNDSAAAGRTLWVVGDSQGHEASRRAELLCISQYLAQLAAIIALARSRGVRVHGALTDIGHSAAFFASALQADDLHALERARVIAMDPAAIARVLAVPASQIASLVEDDPLVGQPLRNFARWGAVADILPDASALGARMSASG